MLSINPLGVGSILMVRSEFLSMRFMLFASFPFFVGTHMLLAREALD